MMMNDDGADGDDGGGDGDCGDGADDGVGGDTDTYDDDGGDGDYGGDGGGRDYDGDVVGGSENTTDGESEELEITDLVNSQKNIETKQDDYFDNLFKQLGDLESKLGSMDNIVNKLNSLEDKIEKYRPKTPEEKLELRSIDSGPYSQKLTDFFVDKQEDMEKSGKNEYILTTDDVENFTDDEIRQSFS